MLTFSVEEGGTNLLNFLKIRVRSAPSVKAIKRALDDRACTVNGQIERFASRQLKKGDKIEFRPKWSGRQQQEIFKLYEDEFLLVIDKPVGFVCDDKEVRIQMPEYHGKIWLAHRLDKETTGCLILAKTPAVKERLKILFTERKIDKTYLTLVHGTMLKESGVIDSFLVIKSRFAGQTVYGTSAQANGNRAITHWKTLDKGTGMSLLECKPVTGRTHQIRVHMSAIGHPVIGDLQYGKRKNEQGIQRCLLHAYQLNFPHPVTQEELAFEAPIPDDVSSHELDFFRN